MEPSSASQNDTPRPLLRPLLPSTAPRGDAPSLPPKRHRVSLACAACRARKTKVKDEQSTTVHKTPHLIANVSVTDAARYATSVWLEKPNVSTPKRRQPYRNADTKPSRLCSRCSSPSQSQRPMPCLPEFELEPTQVCWLSK